MVQWRDNITSKSPGIVRTITPARVILNCVRHDPYDPSCNPKLRRHRRSEAVTPWIEIHPSRHCPRIYIYMYTVSKLLYLLLYERINRGGFSFS